MLTINLITDKGTVAELCKDLGLVYHPGYYCYSAADRGELLATGLFEIGANSASIVNYSSADADDHFLFDGILRAGFNYAGQQGIENGVIPESIRKRFKELFGKLNYPAEAVFSINNFFSKYKNCIR